MSTAGTYTYDVLVIGAGGAGLRAAIEAANAGASVGLVCKSLLGKAHTVMAEGGMAAAMGNNDDRDNWKVHFADTMRGGQYVNNWRMAEIHAREAPDRVRELERWGAVFDRTADGRINQRNFGGHRYPRLAHVGDRTGLELIRTLQDHTQYLGVTIHMEHTVIELLVDGGRVSGAVAYDRERGRFHLFAAKAVILSTGGTGRAYKIYARGRLRHNEMVPQVPSCPVGPQIVNLADQGSGTVMCVGWSKHTQSEWQSNYDRRRPEKQGKAPLHVRRHPGQLQAADRLGCRRGVAVYPGRQISAASARTADARSRRALHQP